MSHWGIQRPTEECELTPFPSSETSLPSSIQFLEYFIFTDSSSRLDLQVWYLAIRLFLFFLFFQFCYNFKFSPLVLWTIGNFFQLHIWRLLIIRCLIFFIPPSIPPSLLPFSSIFSSSSDRVSSCSWSATHCIDQPVLRTNNSASKLSRGLPLYPSGCDLNVCPTTLGLRYNFYVPVHDVMVYGCVCNGLTNLCSLDLWFHYFSQQPSQQRTVPSLCSLIACP